VSLAIFARGSEQAINPSNAPDKMIPDPIPVCFKKLRLELSFTLIAADFLFC
jgi:hypothetical protein